MGCSVSRPNTTFLCKDNNQFPEANHPSFASSYFDNSMFSSSPNEPKALSLQTRLVHHPPSRKGDSHHLVSLTSTTYGSLLLIGPNKLNCHHQDDSLDHPQSPSNSNKSSNHHKTQIPIDPDESLSPDFVINAWELMDGLDDEELDFEMNAKSSRSDDSFEFIPTPGSFSRLGSDGFVQNLHYCFDSSVKSEEIAVDDHKQAVSFSKPLWKHLSEESLLSNMDPIVVSSYRRALSSRQLGYNNKESKNVVRSLDSSPMTSCVSSTKSGFVLHNTEDKIVLYFTSLRGIRKTYEDCYEVGMILRGFRVLVDERDISMDSTYRKELQSVIKGKAMSLPQVFIRGNHVGGVEEIRQLNETGELAKLLDGFPVRDLRFVCASCGDARFVPCPNCNGSRKVFDAEDKQLKCPNCNENGLIRCPCCCS